MKVLGWVIIVGVSGVLLASLFYFWRGTLMCIGTGLVLGFASIAVEAALE
jgi:hypothetical protein